MENQKPETRNLEPETRNLTTRNLKPETRNQKHPLQPLNLQTFKPSNL
jgi:hypothetical protein